MAPIVHGLENKYGDQMIFTYLDIDDPGTNQFKQALNYRFQPHFFLLDPEGQIINQWVGVVSSQVLEETILEALSN
jgi:hypothetical protein